MVYSSVQYPILKNQIISEFSHGPLDAEELLSLPGSLLWRKNTSYLTAIWE